MRILKIELPATLTSIDPDVSLASELLREQLHRELDVLKDELGEDVRSRAISYFPSHYTVFVRFFFWVDDKRAKVILWIDDPTVRWPNGLLARRAWKLSVPIVTHIIKEVFEARVKSIRMDINETQARVASLAPTRAWLDPVVLTVVVMVLSAGYWVLVHPWMWEWLSRAR
jgi:hypothetical protein